MSYSVYPTLRGLGWPVKRTPTWETQVQKMSSGREVRLSYWTNPIWQWELSYGGGKGAAEGYLKDTVNNPLLNVDTDLALIQSFYNLQQGRFGIFLYDDVTPGIAPGQGSWDRVDAQFIGDGDGSTDTFQLIRTIAGFTEAIQTPFSADGVSDPPVVRLNGIAQPYGSVYSVDNIGRIIFATPPPLSPPTTITADFSYYWPVRFDEDNIEFENMLQLLWETKSVKLTQVRL